MSDVSPILSLPLILPAQAQKHVTHNEALRLLDILVQAVVATRGQDVPPATPAAGERHIVGLAPTGLWAGRPGQIAVWEVPGGWAFLVPQPGWSAHVLADDAEVQFIDGAWASAADRALRVSRLGVSTDADATNRLSVSAPATLLNHAGTGGHQLKLNKALAADTASLLFQTGFSGRAEMGTTGSDDFAVKVSSDGSLFRDGLRIEASSGVVEMPQGLRLTDGTAAAPALAFAADPNTGLSSGGADVIDLSAGGVVRASVTTGGLSVTGTVTGTAVSQTAEDNTAGRLVKHGDWGLGAFGVLVATDLDSYARSGTWYIPALNNGTLNVPTQWAADSGPGVFHIMGAGSANNALQLGARLNLNGHLKMRRRRAGTWNDWVDVFTSNTSVGTVSQTSGTPTGALMERGSNANGAYTRFADGTQICTHGLTMSSTAAVTWTFPAAFAVAPVVVGSGVATALSAVCLDAAATVTSVSLSTRNNTARRADAVVVTATGRWF